MKPIDFAEIEIGELENRIEELLEENKKLKDGNLIIWSANQKLVAETNRLKGLKMSNMEDESLDYHNLRCEIAADMLHTSTWLLDEELVRKLNKVHELVNNIEEGELRSRQVIALIVADFEDKNNENNKAS